MKVNKLFLTKLIIIFNFLYFVKTTSFQVKKNDLRKEEASGINEKTISLSEVFNQLELKMSSLIKDKMDLLQDNLRVMTEQLIENKIAKTEKIIEEKLKSNNNAKTSYNVQEIKCPNNRFPRSCNEIIECNSNIYSIMIPEFSIEPVTAVCDLKTLDGGWTIIQRRQDGTENFYRNWTDYVEGFGNMNGEFFIGLEKLHALTSLGEPQELLITLEDFEGEKRYARYREFNIDSKSTEYKLTVSNYSGNAGDCFTQHSGHKFSTRDRDNDVHSTRNCAEYWQGAWWYTECFFSNLNGLYLAGKISDSKSGVSWCHFRGYKYSLKFVQMMIRQKKD